MTDIIVIGGGAAGCMAAIEAAKTGCSVMILDHSSMILKKILATGNGKCNFTNIEQGSGFYHCNDPAFVLHTLSAFSASDAIAFFHQLGVLHKEKNGYCYPITDQAATVRSSLLSELNRLNVEIRTDIGIKTIAKDGKGFKIVTKEENFRCHRCILATGGKASPKTGSDGTGYLYAKKLGHDIFTPLPALTAVEGFCDLVPSISGVRVDGEIGLYIDNKKVDEDHGELQWTDYGISGIPVFQISRYVSIGLHEKRDMKLLVDLFPSFTFEQLLELLKTNADRYEDSKTWNEVLYGIVNSKIADTLCRQMHLDGVAIRIHSDKTRMKLVRRIATALKQITIIPKGVKGFDKAQVTCGGVNTSEICTETMESKLVQGLYFAGEVMDVDAICGGYNLQWAWSTGYVAGKSAGISILKA